MEKVRFGKTELMVSRVALGGIPIMRISKTEASRLVRETLDLGINFIDTANGYADSEEKIGEGIKGVKREDLVITSKSMAKDKKSFIDHIDLSLKRLGTDYIDIYQIHNIASEALRDTFMGSGGAIEGLEEAVKAGKVRFPAFSSHSNHIAIELMKGGKFFAVQLPFNYIDNSAAEEAIPLAKKLDLGFIAMKPMGGGLLDNAGLSFRFLGQYDSVIADPGIEALEEIREIVGIVNKKEALSENDKKEIERLREELGPTWCHRCDYCLPCPQEIHINFALNVKSVYKRMTPERARVLVGTAIEKARTCTGCRTCVSRCPYNLDIPELFKANIAYWDSLQAV